jgi:septum formation topological specificity factor MinE
MTTTRPPTTDQRVAELERRLQLLAQILERQRRATGAAISKLRSEIAKVVESRDDDAA